MTPSKAAEYLIHPPFFKLNGRYLRNPCFLKVQNFTVGLLTIAIRLHEKAWSRTLGSSLAKAADTIISMLPELPRLKVSARRRYPGGDVDVALYDIETQELLVCEVKTVYDKHRTDSLIHRYEDAKINVQKACSQLRETVRAISAGEISMRQLFNTDLSEPQRVHRVLLTWFDPIDITMGTPEEEVLSMNFATFIWLIRAAQGDVKAMAKSVIELRNLWTLSVVRKFDLGQPELTSELERQTSYLDKRSSLDGLSLSPLTEWIVNELDSVDDVVQPDREEKYVSYLEDTRAILSLAN
jgi:hypothetical protein